MKKAAFGAQGVFLWTKPSLRFGTQEAVVVDNFPIMSQRWFGLKLIHSVTIKAKLRSRAITK